MTTPMELARIKRKQMKLDGIKPVCNPITKSDNKPASKALAIKAACFECYGGTREDTRVSKEIRDGIRECSSRWTCSLHKMRSYK